MSPGCGCILLGEGLRDVTQTFVQTEVQSGRHGDASSARIFGRNLHRRREVYPVITLAGDYILCNVCVLRLYILVYTFLYILRFFGPSSTGSVGTFLASQSSHLKHTTFCKLILASLWCEPPQTALPPQKAIQVGRKCPRLWR